MWPNHAPEDNDFDRLEWRLSEVGFEKVTAFLGKLFLRFSLKYLTDFFLA